MLSLLPHNFPCVVAIVVALSEGAARSRDIVRSAHQLSLDPLHMPESTPPPELETLLVVGPVRAAALDAELSDAAKLVSFSHTATDADAPDDELTRKLQLPDSDISDIPLLLDVRAAHTSRGGGSIVLSTQSSTPFTNSSDWRITTRPNIAGSSGDSATNVVEELRIGGKTPSIYLSPTSGELVWGIGPSLLVPSASPGGGVGSGQWGGGPSGVVLQQSGGWTYGAHANHLWSVSGEDTSADSYQTNVQPFVSYTFQSTTTTIDTESTYNWSAQQWSSPLNVTLGREVRIGDLPLRVRFGSRYVADSPREDGEWGLRFAVELLPFR